MSFPEIINCPGTLTEGHSTYSRTCLNRVFNGKKVSHVLPYASPSVSDEDKETFVNNRKRISISGVQEKVSLLLEKNKLRLTEEGERGTYILKPIPRDLLQVDQVPANEHLTMQIARQVYSIETAENALIFFKNGDPAYITRRFDIKQDGTRWGVEDFASLAGRTSETHGDNYKYEYSYERMAELMRRFVPAYAVEIEKFFKLVVFNFLFSNGDAHLKNFSLRETPNGDYILSPAYDLINTGIHVRDSFFALSRELFDDEFVSGARERYGHPCQDDFLELARRSSISEKRSRLLLQPFQQHQKLVESLTARSYLEPAIKKKYLKDYDERLRMLNTI